MDWVGSHFAALAELQIVSTGTTGRRIADRFPALDVVAVKSGPLGGDQQIGAMIMICEGSLDALIFFVDPLTPMPHDVDVKALTRLTTVYDLPMACNPSTANLIMRGMLGHSTGRKMGTGFWVNRRSLSKA